jgi:NTP pyrophosphatase (non-canonical NTP hydrolase)
MEGGMSNGLSKAETERLALLAEECGEVSQAVGKIFRHGYESTHPRGRCGPTNRETLGRELGDLRSIVELMTRQHDVAESALVQGGIAKTARLRRWLRAPENIASCEEALA